jgi:addiction module RelE/StbE family toxin
MAELRFTRRAARDIRKIPPGLRKTLEIALDQLIDSPKAGEPLHGNWEGFWKLRVADYRIIYRIVNAHVVEVQYVRHRHEAYRR